MLRAPGPHLLGWQQPDMPAQPCRVRMRASVLQVVTLMAESCGQRRMSLDLGPRDLKAAALEAILKANPQCSLHVTWVGLEYQGWPGIRMGSRGGIQTL